MSLIRVDGNDRPEPPDSSQEAHDAAYLAQLGRPAPRIDPAHSVSLWLRGRSFALGTHPDANLGAAHELIRQLWRDGYIFEYVGDDRPR